MAVLGAAPQEPGLELLRRAATAQGGRFVGTRQVQVKERGALKTHEERVIRDGRRLRIEFSPGSRFEGQHVIELPHGRFIVDPQRREIRKLATRGEETEQRLARFVDLVQSGKISARSGDGGNVAGLRTRRVVLMREGKPFVAFSIDPKSAVVLRRESFGPSGSRLGNYVYTHFERRGKIAPTHFLLPQAGYRMVSPLDDLRELSRRMGLPLRYLPAMTGYRLEGSRARKTPAGTILASFYSGGGKRLTLFASPNELPDLARRGTGSRTTPADVFLHRWREGTVWYGLLGEEPMGRLKALAATIGVRD